MKSGRSIQDVSREILRQQKAKADYLVATDRLHMDTWGGSPVIRVLDREGIDQIEPLEIQQTAHQQIGTYSDWRSRTRSYCHKQPRSLECAAHQGVCLQNRLLMEPPQQT